MTRTDLAATVRAAARPLLGGSADYDALLGAIQDARFVLIGEASHGTHEFYRERARLTRRLIDEKGFTAVLVEADWPDAYRVNRFVRGQDDGGSALEALRDFQRFPKWMWRNEDVLQFAQWLRSWNTEHAGNPGQSGRAPCGFYGMDLYSLHRSMQAVVEYLEGVDPAAAARARSRYACFEDFGSEGQEYGLQASVSEDACEDAAVAQLLELQQREGELTRGSVLAEDEPNLDEYFYAEQNARLAQNAERYYRSMYRGRVSSWNLRDTHMADTLDALVAHQAGQGLNPKVVLWAHNSHLGDARATEMGRGGELNVGQLLRERHGGETFSVGFTTYEGTVLAADDWGGEGRVKRVRLGLRGSYEELLHEVSVGLAGADFWLNLREDHPGVHALREERLQRAIGVIYRPQTERWSHYFHANAPEQFDALLHFDRTSAVVPLDRTSGTEDGEWPDTFPSGQ